MRGEDLVDLAVSVLENLTSIQPHYEVYYEAFG